MNIQCIINFTKWITDVYSLLRMNIQIYNYFLYWITIILLTCTRTCRGWWWVSHWHGPRQLPPPRTLWTSSPSNTFPWPPVSLQRGNIGYASCKQRRFSYYQRCRGQNKVSRFESFFYVWEKIIVECIWKFIYSCLQRTAKSCWKIDTYDRKELLNASDSLQQVEIKLWEN